MHFPKSSTPALAFLFPSQRERPEAVKRAAPAPAPAAPQRQQEEEEDSSSEESDVTGDITWRGRAHGLCCMPETVMINGLHACRLCLLYGLYVSIHFSSR